MRRVPAAGLDLNLFEWEGGDTTLLLLHGFLDTGGTFGPLVRHLDPSLHVLAPDMRGHGRSGRVSADGSYHFYDYVRDVRALVRAHARQRLVILGHSMGGGIATLYTGSWPEEVDRLILVEGLGPMAERVEDGPARMRRWINELDAPGEGKRYGSLAEVAASLVARNRGLDPALAEELAGHLAHDDGAGWTWRHDRLHRTRNPQPYDPSRYTPFLDAIACPVLLVTGGRSWYRYPDLPERRAHLRDRRRVHWPDCGHMVHWERPAELGAAVSAFVAGREPEGVRTVDADAIEPGPPGP
jgi:pimeloyl-ACP methyl ester carboxylesterase